MPPKKPKLTPEEKKALRIQKKAEKKRRAEEKKRQLKIDQLERELKYGRLTIKRHEKSWKDLLLSIGIPEIQKQLLYAWHNFERVIDAKDFQISLLLDEIKDGEEQYMMNIRSHCENIDRLIRLFNEQLDELNEDNKQIIRNMKFWSEQDVDKIMGSHKEHEDYLKMMLYGLEVMQKEQEQFIRCEYCARIEEELGKNADLLQKLSSDIHDMYAKFWVNTHDFLDKYHARTHERRKQYEHLHTQEVQVNILLQNQLERIIYLNEMIRKLKYKKIKLENTQGQMVLDLLMERHFFSDSFWSLKTQLEGEIETDNKKLTLLTVLTNEAIEVLQNHVTKGEHILQLASICRKYETIQEKVLPFPTLGRSFRHVPVDVDFFEDIQDLKVFWKRVGQADAVRYSMYEERAFLKKENNKIRSMIHRYCECLNCVAYPSPSKKPNKLPINTTDAKHVWLKYHKQNRTDLLEF